MNIAQARMNMIQQQIRPWEVLDETVLNLLERIPREFFVPEAYRSLAFADIEIPLGHGMVMLPPRVEARMLQALDIQPTDKVLEIGTGSGYMTALLASLAGHVDSVECIPELYDMARQQLQRYGISNVTLHRGDAAQGWLVTESYDVIVLTGSLPMLPESFRYSLRIAGRILAVLGHAPAMACTLITRPKGNEWHSTILFETVIPPLLNAAPKSAFAF